MGFLQELPKYRSQIYVSLMIFVSFFLYAGQEILLGTCLLDMEIQVQQDFATTSRLITSHSMGYFFGAVIVTLYDKHLNDFVSMSAGLSLAGIALIIIPFVYNFYVVAITSLLSGIGHSIYDLKCHIALTCLWGPEKVGNSLQILHMFFGLGALFCPAFVRIFLLPIPDDMMNDYEAYKNLYKPEDVQIMWPFIIFGTPSIIFGIFFLYYYFNCPYSEAQQEERRNNEKNCKSIENGDSKADPTKSSGHPKWKIFLAVALVGAMAHLAFAMGQIVCSYVQAFGVKSSLHMDKQTAALVATVFWTSFTLARGLFVGLTIILPEQSVVNVCLLMMVASTVLLLGFLTASPICLWVTAVLLGAGNSPLFPVAYSLIGKYFPLTGQHTSLIFLSGIIGDAIHTSISGTFINDDPMIFAYYVGAIVGGFTLLSFSLPFICRKIFGEMPKNAEDAESKGRSRIGSFMMPPLPQSRNNSTTPSIY
ncbi:sodium-dependent glucose transporter 1A-like [Brevipalpus obovatus]|uniref:sodium-dependent glucose transporter 1A-like n=1 Tax=Brevipalpus obovatus TaxID=246614 RepID=UPI003D9F98A1